MASGGEGREPRLPKDVKGLLQYCAELSNQETADENVTFEPMSAERREWLEKALENATVSPVGEMKKAIEIIQKEESDTDDRVAALETLVEWCEHMDFAIDFHKIGGFVIFPLCLESEEPEIRWQCLELIAALVQNNPYCQAAILQNGLMPTILHMLDTDPDPMVKTKALYAVSCLTRECEEATVQFLSQDGFSVLMRAMQTDIEKVKIKSAFMLSGICKDNDKCKDIICDTGMIDQLVGHLSEEHTMFHEHVLSALLTIVRGHDRSVQQCLRPELNLVSLLHQKEEDLKGKEQFLEEYEYTKELLDLLKTSPSPSQNSSEQDVTR